MEQKIIKISIEKGQLSNKDITGIVSFIMNDEKFVNYKKCIPITYFSTTSDVWASATKYNKSVSIKIWNKES